MCAFAKPETAQGIVLSFPPKIVQVLVDRIVGAPIVPAGGSTPSSIFKQPHHAGYDFFLFFLGRRSLPFFETEYQSHIFDQIGAVDLFGCLWNGGRPSISK